MHRTKHHNILPSYTTMSLTQTLAAALALLGTTAGHMIMQTPPPFAPSLVTSSPLSSDNFPCQISGDVTAFYARTNVTKMAIGEKQKLNFKGSAVHNGGSCQLAITSDLMPSKSTHWQVLMSIIGGCPALVTEGP